MILLDSNIIIYAAQPSHHKLRKWLGTQIYTVSDLSRLEVMGYYLLSENEITYFAHFFNRCILFPISKEIIETAIQLRRNHNMSLGDSVIAGTALNHDQKLCTNNQKDFESIENLHLADISKLI